MPKATIDREETFRFDLKTLPANNGDMGGYVVLRRLSYHQMMQRRDIASKIGWEERRSRGRKNEDESVKAMMEVMNVATMEYEFRHSIVEHNLEDEAGRLIDFQNPESYKNLHPAIGAEIGKIIDALNPSEDDIEVDLENFPIVSKPSFGEERTPTGILEES